jgi:hypothetical protein
MTTLGKTLRMGMAAALLLAGITTGAQGFAPGGGGSFGGGVRSVLQLRGTVLCAGCSLEEARKAQPNERQLYELRHRRGHVVMRVSAVNGSQVWGRVVWPPQLWVRAKDQVFLQLCAEENLWKELEITGLLNTSRTLDIFRVTIRG